MLFIFVTRDRSRPRVGRRKIPIQARIHQKRLFLADSQGTVRIAPVSYITECARWFAIGGAAVGFLLVAVLTIARWTGEGEGFGFSSFFPAFFYTITVVLIVSIQGLIAGVIVGALLELVDFLGTEVHRFFHWLGG